MLESVTVNSVVKILGNLPDLFKSATSDSLVSYTSNLRMEPLVLVDTTLQDQEVVSNALSVLTNTFSGYVLQAFTVSATIGKINVQRHLDKLNPNRSISDSLIGTLSDAISTESYKHRLPNYSKPTSAYHLGLEAAEVCDTIDTIKHVSKDAISTLYDIPSLSVGKTLEVTLVKDGESLTFPIQVRLAPVGISPVVFKTTFGIGGFKNSPSERFHRWRDGELTFIGDLIWCNDLIDQHRETLRVDKSGFYKQVLASRRNNRIAAIFSGQPSVASASNIAIISASTAKAVEVECGGELKSAKIRDGIFKTSSLMLLCVLDTEWERVTIYHRGIALPSELSFRDLKPMAKNSGPDIGEILKAYTAAKAPAY